MTDLKPFERKSNQFAIVAELVNSHNKVIGRANFQSGGTWEFNRRGRPQITVSGEDRKQVAFQNVKADDITDNLTIRIANVNGRDAVSAAQAGVLQIRAWSVERGKFTDSRNNLTYRTITIEDNTWMAENLNFRTANSYCYGNDNSNCAKYGRLYTWDAAMSACPAGWRLPGNDDWNGLVAVAGGDVAGTALKTKTPAWDGTDAFGFSALPGGYRGTGGNFGSVGSYGYWWSATEYGSDDAHYRNMYSGYANVDGGAYGKSDGFSVRCLRD